jgi:hypothetical protein
MRGFFSRPSRRPRSVRRTPVRPVLRVESLETRANPSAPALTVVHANWSDPNDVVVTGTVSDAHPGTTQVTVYSEGSLASAFASTAGGFMVSLHTDTPGPAYIQAHNDQGRDSAVVMDTSNPGGTGESAPTIGNINITNSNGQWVITGTVTGGTPGATVITVGGAGSGQTVVDDPGGSFKIGISVNNGGFISITATNIETGDSSDPIDTPIG